MQSIWSTNMDCRNIAMIGDREMAMKDSWNYSMPHTVHGRLTEFET